MPAFAERMPIQAGRDPFNRFSFARNDGIYSALYISDNHNKTISIVIFGIQVS